jgi:hypothetical protein
MKKSIFMETTEISPEKTINEIEALLCKSGASAIVKDFKSGETVAVAFKISAGGQDIPFRLPCRWEAIQKQLCERREDFKNAWSDQQIKEIRTRVEPQAKRVAWRQILRWIQAQLALVDTEMVKMEEVFMPYVQLRGGKTIFEVIQAKQFQLEDQR